MCTMYVYNIVFSASKNLGFVYAYYTSAEGLVSQSDLFVLGIAQTRDRSFLKRN